jgi:Holliday junction resolvase-like predicted endonuclease
MEQEGLLQLHNEQVTASPKQRLNLALLAIQAGVDVEHVSTLMNWQEFEDLVIVIMHHNGFTTQKHFRFPSQTQRFEIDVIGTKSSLLLLIECKRWKKSWQTSATRKIVEEQLKRTKAFINSYSKIRRKLRMTKQKQLKVLPLILTMSETPFKLYKKLPVIPIFYFQNFLQNELTQYPTRFQLFELLDPNKNNHD